MLYSFDIQYFEELHHCNLVVPIIMDLPQTQLTDVKLNPFVIDIVNHPFIKAGIEAIPNHKTDLTENIVVYLGIVQNTATDITCRYQEEPGLGNVKSFSFKIFADIPNGYFFPYSQLDFTCRGDFDSYDRLYTRGQLVKAPQIPNTSTPIRDGYYYLLYLQASVELLRVIDAHDPNNILMESISGNGSISQITMTLTNRNQMRPLRLTDQLLMMIGFKSYYGNLFNLYGIDYFEGSVMGRNGSQVNVYVQKDTVGYILLVADYKVNAVVHTIKVFRLHELQEALWSVHKAKISLSNQLQANICYYWINVEMGGEIINELPRVLWNYLSQNKGNQPTRDQIVSHVAGYFGIKNIDASHYVAGIGM